MTIEDVLSAVDALLGSDPRPIVVYSGIWSLFRAIPLPPETICSRLAAGLVEVAQGRTLMMPTYAGGYRDGICDLDHEPSRNGVLSEAFRRLPGAARTLSAYFTFSVLGPDRDRLAALVPDEIYGPGSVYEWMEETNARFLTLGVHQTVACYLHRMEWLIKERIPYRYTKAFEGILRRDGKDMPTTERIFVRSLQPEAVNDFTFLLEPLRQLGLQESRIAGMSAGLFDAAAGKEALLTRLMADPLAALKNRKDFEEPARQ